MAIIGYVPFSFPPRFTSLFVTTFQFSARPRSRISSLYRLVTDLADVVKKVKLKSLSVNYSFIAKFPSAVRRKATILYEPYVRSSRGCWAIPAGPADSLNGAVRGQTRALTAPCARMGTRSNARGLLYYFYSIYSSTSSPRGESRTTSVFLDNRLTDGAAVRTRLWEVWNIGRGPVK